MRVLTSLIKPAYYSHESHDTPVFTNCDYTIINDYNIKFDKNNNACKSIQNLFDEKNEITIFHHYRI